MNKEKITQYLRIICEEANVRMFKIRIGETDRGMLELCFIEQTGEFLYQIGDIFIPNRPSDETIIKVFGSKFTK